MDSLTFFISVSPVISISGYDTLFEHMNKVQGSYEIKCAFVQEIIHEAGRFKKKVLIDLLEKFERSLTQHSKTNDKFR
jgi:hypothetical protein